MKLTTNHSRQDSGISLIETLVYIACLSMLFSIVAISCWKLKSYHDAINQRAELTARLLDIGEQWRAYVRSADKIQVEPDAGLRFSQAGKDHSIVLKSGSLLHLSREATDTLIKNVSHSQMKQLERNGVVYWQWEVGVAPMNGHALQRFTFLAVPQKDKEKIK